MDGCLRCHVKLTGGRGGAQSVDSCTSSSVLSSSTSSFIQELTCVLTYFFTYLGWIPLFLVPRDAHPLLPLSPRLMPSSLWHH